MMDIDVHQIIHEILSDQTGTGNFKKIVQLSDGKIHTHNFSWSVGMHLNHISSQYKRHFGSSLPSWVDLQHPYHIIRLCKSAIKVHYPLPELLILNKKNKHYE